MPQIHEQAAMVIEIAMVTATELRLCRYIGRDALAKSILDARCLAPPQALGENPTILITLFSHLDPGIGYYRGHRLN